MVLSKKFFLRLFFVAEIVVFVWIYVAGFTGVSKMTSLKKENQLLLDELVLLEKEVKKLEDDFQKWEHIPFYKEKCAREELQMARDTDDVYFFV